MSTLHLALFEPEIPPNTGNIIRLCANMGAQLHLIGTLGFELDDKRLRRAGLDYAEYAAVHRHDNLAALTRAEPRSRLIACSTRAQQFHTDCQYQDGDILLFGPETRGLPASILAELPAEQQVRIPMLRTSRSMNLSNAASVIAYEAWRQLGYRNAV